MQRAGAQKQRVWRAWMLATISYQAPFELLYASRQCFIELSNTLYHLHHRRAAQYSGGVIGCEGEK